MKNKINVNVNVKEKDIENEILEYLSTVPNSLFWKNQSIGVYDPIKRIYRKSNNKHHLNGVSDILGIYQGVFVAIEVKTPPRRKTVSPQQKYFLDTLNDLGGHAFIATSIDEVIMELDNLEEKKGLI